jgi:hypothetical protein
MDPKQQENNFNTDYEEKYNQLKKKYSVLLKV